MILVKIFKYFKRNGLALTIKESGQRLINKTFNLMLVGRLDIYIDASARIIGLSKIKIGDNFQAGKHLWMEAVLEHNNRLYSPQIIIKNNVSVSDFVHIGATNYVEIGNNVLMGSKVYISDHNHGVYTGEEQSSPYEPPNKRIVNSNCQIIIEDNVWIGEMVSILPGVVIGFGSIIGSGSVVTKSIPPLCIAVGNPARVIKTFDSATNSWVNVNKNNESES